MGLLTGRVAFVTGAASGIGRATAMRMAEEGAFIGVADLHEEGVIDEIKEAGSNGIFLPCDVSDSKQMQRAIESTVTRFGRLDIVVANAGINGVWAPIDELLPEEWDKTIATNLRSTFLTLHFSVPYLKKTGSGSIIIMSSVNGNRSFGTAGAHAYSTSKAGQVALMKMAALELGRCQVRVNAVCPGAIHTNIEESTTQRDTEQIGLDVEFPKGMPAVNKGQGEARDVADVCLFLASDASRHVSGVEMYVDGGMSLLK